MPHRRWGCFTENSLDPSTNVRAERIPRAIHRLVARIERHKLVALSHAEKVSRLRDLKSGRLASLPRQTAGFEISNLCSPLWENTPCFGGTAERHDVLRHAGKRGKEGGELCDLKRLRVGRKDDVLVVQLNLLRKEIAGRIGEAH
jgi:hypothetical protein